MLKYQKTKFKEKSQLSYATLEDIHKAVLRIFVPSDLATFNDLLLQSCAPYSVIRTSSDYKKDFEDTSTGLYHLREVFKERYGFLLESAKLTENERSYPAFNFKKGDLL